MTIIKRLPQWNRDRATICERIASRIAPFKILLKTKDEPDRLRTWIEHHSGIVGLENLIVFDNMSMDQATLDIYTHFESELLVVQFDDFLDAVHHTRIFAELYAALRESCDYFTFLDTDEYLALYDGGDGFHFRKEIVSFLRDHKKTMVFPGTWLRNLPGCHNRFMLSQSGWPTLRYGLEWGKPVISSACDVSGDIHHNRRVKYDMLPNDLITNLFVFHRLQVSSAERIRINVQKLRSYELLAADEGLEEALALDIDTLSRREIRAYVLEIRRLISAGDKLPSIEGSFEIGPNGRVNWENEWQRADMQMFVSQPLKYRDVCFAQTLVHPLHNCILNSPCKR